MGVVDDLLRARAAYDRRDWLAAYGGLSETGDDELTAEDFVRLATAAYLVGRRNDCVQALQRAYQLHVDSGDVAGRRARGVLAGLVLLMNGEAAVGGRLGRSIAAPVGRRRRRRGRARIRAHPPDVPARLRRPSSPKHWRWPSR